MMRTNMRAIKHTGSISLSGREMVCRLNASNHHGVFLGILFPGVKYEYGESLGPEAGTTPVG